jgi:hypothetical protein
MGATSETRTYDALISTTLENWANGIEDAITTSIFAYYMLKRSKSWIGVDALGERAKYPLRYKNGNAQPYSGYDLQDTTPIDGITCAFYPWAQLSVPVSISRIEERKNSGEYAMLDLLEEKANQAMDGIHEAFTKGFLQGNGINAAASITTAWTSTTSGSTFVTPLALLVGQTATSGTIGGIAANVSDGGVSWWANQKVASLDTNFASQLKSLRNLYNSCSKGVGGGPDMHLVDQATAEWYEAALASQNRFTEYQRADIPFDNVMFRKSPVVWDEFMPNWSGTTTVQSTTQGSWVMLNSKFVQVKFDNQTNFSPTPYVKPENQDAKVSQIQWYGAIGTTNRRKLGVDSDIDTTVTS